MSSFVQCCSNYWEIEIDIIIHNIWYPVKYHDWKMDYDGVSMGRLVILLVSFIFNKVLYYKHSIKC